MANLKEMKDVAIETYHDMKRRELIDYITRISFAPSGIVLENGHIYDIRDPAFGQVSSDVGMSHSFSRALYKENCALWSEVMNTMHDPDKRVMVRTKSNGAMAVLSRRYLRVRSADIFEPMMDLVIDHDGLPLGAWAGKIDHMRFLWPNIREDIAPGDGVSPMVEVIHSEFGLAPIRVRVGFFRHFCLNGCVFGREYVYAYSRKHISRRVPDAFQVLDPPNTVPFEMHVIQKALASAVTNFREFIQPIKESAMEEIDVDDVREFVKMLTRTVAPTLTRDRKAAVIDILTEIKKDRKITRWDVSNAITQMSHNQGFLQGEEGLALEQEGGNILTLSTSRMRGLAAASAA